MLPNRETFLNNICYTDLVFKCVNKKLQTDYSIVEIKNLANQIIGNPQTTITKNGKNYYLLYQNIELVVNSFNFRLITANRK